MRDLTIRNAKVEDTENGAKLYVEEELIMEIDGGDLILQEDVDITSDASAAIEEFLRNELTELEFHGNEETSLEHEIHDFLKKYGLKTNPEGLYREFDGYPGCYPEGEPTYCFLGGYWALSDRSRTFNAEFYWYLERI